MKKSILIAGSVTAAAGTATAIAVPIVLTSDNSTENIEHTEDIVEDIVEHLEIDHDNVHTEVNSRETEGTQKATAYVNTFEITSCGNQGEDIVLTSDEWSGELTIPCVESEMSIYTVIENPVLGDGMFNYKLYYGDERWTTEDALDEEKRLTDNVSVDYDKDKTFELTINGVETVTYLEVSNI